MDMGCPFATVSRKVRWVSRGIFKTLRGCPTRHELKRRLGPYSATRLTSANGYVETFVPPDVFGPSLPVAKGASLEPVASICNHLQETGPARRDLAYAAPDMSFSDFTIGDITARLGLSVHERDMFSESPPHPPGPWLTSILDETVSLALSLGNEKARSELLIAPVLLEVRRMYQHQISLFSGIELNVDSSRGLVGVCDFLLSRSPEQLILRAPVVAVVEAKQENIRGGLGQCAAEMVAAQLFNSRDGGSPVESVHGTVTTGDMWRFLKLTGSRLVIDTEQYPLARVERILGIFRSILGP